MKVFGVGGGGGNAISRMKESFNTRVVELIAVNTDIQD
ncbi:MAG: cell division protein FtsZ, partial [Candidatus Harrisonbacteria bacterium CG10_big_fil_rev_8_21_14_0_10_38_8]